MVIQSNCGFLSLARRDFGNLISFCVSMKRGNRKKLWFVVPNADENDIVMPVCSLPKESGGMIDVSISLIKDGDNSSLGALNNGRANFIRKPYF
ncbi:hypothetical protein C5167_043570 [Papaver somniferum]|uniref:Uncharacterized protein n=1 Tax=Papaver somniferum TaxID=3469 RepID=A0A4Y7L727_PAPSO|nr:hypothetical protein C5167_043570 [Papaver somniferum]